MEWSPETCRDTNHNYRYQPPPPAPAPDIATTSSDIESNLRRVTPMLIRQPDDEVSMLSPSLYVAAYGSSRTLLRCSMFVAALQTVPQEQHMQHASGVSILSSLFTAILSTAKVSM
ncbi:TPA: hypothetical protein ACH3X2_004541 [Trebouxia sp. C0005]